MSTMAMRLEAEIPALRRYAFALLRDHNRADDLVQDCLERAISRWYLRRTDGDLRAWLFTIMRNLHISAGRQSQRRGPHHDLDTVMLPGSPADQDHGIAVCDILEALDRLSDDQKSLLLLVGVEDLSYEQAAAVIGVPVGTVMSRLSRARQKFRSILDNKTPVTLRRVK